MTNDVITNRITEFATTIATIDAPLSLLWCLCGSWTDDEGKELGFDGTVCANAGDTPVYVHWGKGLLPHNPSLPEKLASPYRDIRLCGTTP